MSISMTGPASRARQRKGVKEREVRVALIGIGGYGSQYVSALLDGAARHGVRWTAAVDPAPGSCRRMDELRTRQLPVFAEVDELFLQQQAELVIVCSPIHLHCAHTVASLQHGAHVLCEKPLCVTMEQAAQMIQARDAAAREVALGYQWSFCPAVQQLKRDILDGVFGRPRRLKAMVLWPRDERYYRRNNWAGRQYGEQGEPIFDSPVSNACAHYLHNMLYVLGERTHLSASAASVTAELYRAHKIENFDTAALRLQTGSGVPVLFIVSHVTRHARGPAFVYEFERAVVEFDDQKQGQIVARFNDGSVRMYGVPASSTDISKLWQTVEAVRTGERTVCGIEAAVSQTQVVCAAQQSMPQIVPFPSALVQVSGDAGSRRTSVSGLEDVLVRCYEQFALPSELGVTWSAPGREVQAAASAPAQPPRGKLAVASAR